MHYCTLVFTKEFPTDAVLQSAMAPYYEDDYYRMAEEDESTPRPLFMWDWMQIGGRYGGLLKLDVRQDEQKKSSEVEMDGVIDLSAKPDKYEVHWSTGKLKAGRLFRSQCLEKIAKQTGPQFMKSSNEDSAICYMGIRDGFLAVDGALCADILNLDEISGYNCIDADGNAYSRSSWEGARWVDNPDYDAQVAAVRAKSADCYLTIIDIHD